MRTTISIFVCKLVTKLCRIFKRNGSVYPGGIVFDFIDKNVLDKIKYPPLVIAVTGSSGKGSTTEVIAHILKDNHYDVIYNGNGSNGILAAMTLILNNCNYKGEFKHEVLLFECDERHLKLIFNKHKMSHLVITNVTRDQPARNGYPDLVFKDIKDAIDDSVSLIINADDPLVNRLSYTHKGNVIKYGLEKTKDSYKNPSTSTDYAYCPFCHKKLIYGYYHYGHLGSYACPSDDFKRGELNYTGSKIDLDKQTMLINDNLVNINKDVLYACYYTIAAFSLCHSIGLKEEKILYSLNSSFESKRAKVYNIFNRELIMLESKNENNLSYYQSIKYITSKEGTKTVILGFDNVSRRYKLNDLSWLWDVDFELLNDPSINKILVIGRFRYDVVTRLAYTKVPPNKIILVDNLDDILNIIKEKTQGTIFTMVCFDMTAVLKKLIKGDNNENN